MLLGGSESKHEVHRLLLNDEKCMKKGLIFVRHFIFQNGGDCVIIDAEVRSLNPHLHECFDIVLLSR